MSTAEDRPTAPLPEMPRKAAGPRRRPERRFWAAPGGLPPVSARTGALLLGTAVGFNLVGNLVFHTLVARKSTVGSYGITSLFLSFGIVAGVLSSGFQYATARQVVHQGTTMGAEYRKVAPWLALIVPLGLAVVLYPPIGGFVHVDDPVALSLTVVYLAITIVQAVPLGMLNGERHFRTITISVVIGVTTRVVLFPLLVGGRQTTNTALLASDVSTLVATAVAFAAVVVLRRGQGGGDTALLAVSGTAPAPGPDGFLAMEEVPATRRRFLRDEGSTEGMVGAVLGAGLWSAWILSLVFARHYLSARSAGLFSVAHVAAGAILFLAAPVVTAYVPSVARSFGGARPVVVGLLLTAAIGVVCTASLVLFGQPVISGLYGRAYPPAVSLLGAQGASASLVACATFLLWASRTQRVRLLVHKRAFYLGVPVAAGLEVVAAVLWHDSSVALALGPGLSVAVGVGCGVGVDVLLHRSAASPTRPLNTEEPS